MEFCRNVSIPIVIRPDQVDQLQQNIISKLLSDIKNHCIEDVGYVSDIIEIVKVTSKNITNKTGNANFDVECKLLIIQPKIGDVIEGTVNKLMNDKGLTAINGPVEIFAKWSPAMRNINEHHKCKFKISQFRHDEDRILCVGDLQN